MASGFRSPAKVARRLRLTPLAARKIRNWPTFMYHYALGMVPAGAYCLRSGAKLRIYRGVDHVPIIEIFLRQEYGSIQDDAVVLDIGAHIGVFSIYAATMAHGARVYAFEPDPEAFKVLRANLSLNAMADTVRTFNVAVAGGTSDRELLVSGTSFFFPTLVKPANADTNRTNGIRVGCTTLEEILDANALDRVHLLKMDIEGSEYEVLYATSAACLQRVDRIRMEYHDLDEDNRNAAALRRFLVNHGYRITHDRPTTGSNGMIWAERG